jgi:putative transposase
MDGSIVLGSSQRKRLLEIYRGSGGKELHHPQVRLRAHVILLLSEGHPWSLIEQVLFCSTATIARWKGRFESGGVDALLEERRGRAATLLVGWALVLVGWVKQLTPRDFGYCRSRWCCATLALVLLDTHKVKVSAETVRRCLHAKGLVWRRPRPVLGQHDPRRAWKLRRIRELLRDLPEDEAAVFQDEVDLNLNPDIGCMWMERGKQAEVVTPGDNVKRYLSGSMSWRTGELVATLGARRNAELFVAHLEDLRRRFRRYRVIHVICDNARFHTVKGSRLVRQYLAEHGDRIVLHYLPARSPKDNPIERVWWHLHEQITRNHRCASIEELVKLTMAWLDEHGAFKIEGRMYERLKAVA